MELKLVILSLLSNKVEKDPFKNEVFDSNRHGVLKSYLKPIDEQTTNFIKNGEFEEEKEQRQQRYCCQKDSDDSDFSSSDSEGERSDIDDQSNSFCSDESYYEELEPPGVASFSKIEQQDQYSQRIQAQTDSKCGRLGKGKSAASCKQEGFTSSANRAFEEERRIKAQRERQMNDFKKLNFIFDIDNLLR